MILCARAYGDERFNRFPMTFRCLAICCAHSNSYTGVFFVNQSTISKVMGSSQQAISQHMQRLIEYGYLEKLRNADVRRKYGRKGALWRVIFDPRMSYKDTLTKQPTAHRDPELEQEIAENTINMINNNYKSKRKSVDKKEENKVDIVQGASSNNKSNKRELVSDNKVELVNNSSDITNNIYIDKNDCRSMCQSYKQLIYEMWGTDWRYDMRQETLAEDLLKLGYTKDSFLQDAKKMLQWKRNQNKPPIQSLQYFISRKKNKEKPQDVQGIIKHISNRMKLR